MARIRSIKPEFWQDSRMANQPALVRMVFLCLWSMADDEGRLEGDALAVWRFGSFRETSGEVANALAALRGLGRVLVYEAEGNPYIQVVNFNKHQRIDHPSKSKYPAYTNGCDLLHESSREILESSRIRAPDLDLDLGAGKGSGIRDAAVPLPMWLNAEQWNAYIKIRPSKARKPESLIAAIKKLEKFKAAGFDPNEIVSESLANGWQGLFKPKGSNTAIGGVAANNAAVAQRFAERKKND